MYTSRPHEVARSFDSAESRDCLCGSGGDDKGTDVGGVAGQRVGTNKEQYMKSSIADELNIAARSGQELFSKDRSILEREVMEFRPFGLDEQGQTIRDMSGMSIRAVVVYLESSQARERGASAGTQAVEDLCHLLNQRIKDPVYHVTPEFLKNAWNSYSYEFTVYLYEFCERMSGDPQFLYRGGMEKASSIMQVLARPFSLSQIYGMFPYFGNKFASGSIEFRVVHVTSTSATLALKFSERTLRQFGPYRRRCAQMVCQAAQGIMAAVPVRVHGLAPATLTEMSCIAHDDEWCQWSIRWQPEGQATWRSKAWHMMAGSVRASVSRLRDLKCAASFNRRTGNRAATMAPIDPVATVAPSQWYVTWSVCGLLAGLALAVGLHLINPSAGLSEAVLLGLIPVLGARMLINWHLRLESRQRESLIQEQIRSVESRHEELREAYLEQEQTRVELRRKVVQLTALHQAGLLFSSTLDREALMQKVLETLTGDLQYDRAMVSFYDPIRRVVMDARVLGVSPEIQAFARAREIPVTDPTTPEGVVLLQGQPLLVGDVQSVWDRIHPLNRQFALLTQTKSWIAVPLKVKDRILGSLTVDRIRAHSLTQDDLELMMTVAHQVAIALDNASAYEQIEDLNVGLEVKVRERTAELEQADRLRSQFLSHVSHELKTPLTSIKGFLQNLLDGLTGPLNEKQQRYLSRMLENSDRLIRMIDALLDRTTIQSGRLDLVPVEIDLGACVAEAVEQLRLLAQAKQQTLEVVVSSVQLMVWADRDRLIQIVTNLLQNAVKFTPEGGRILVTVRKENQTLAGVSVHDTGPGIPPEFLDQIFDPFFRVKQARTGTKGLGLGLSIVRTLVELQGGTITARSELGQGAELSFTIPLLPTMAVPRSDVSTEAPCILVVEDDPDIRQLLQDRFRAMGYRAQLVADGVRAVEVMRAERFGGMILDIGIPSMDGMEVLREIRKWDQQIPIVVVTASGSKESAVRAIGMGAQAYMLKPFDVDELQRVVNYWFHPLERPSSELVGNRVYPAT
jgi:signal transduction histidine kinase/CheY-like chemotaxis protein